MAAISPNYRLIFKTLELGFDQFCSYWFLAKGPSVAEKGTSRSNHVFLISILRVACYFIAFVSSRCASDRQSGINTGLELLLANNCSGCHTELRPLGLKIGVSFWRRGLLMEQCNFQAVELTHISLCGTNLPVMNLSGHCGASTNESVFLALLELGGREWCRGNL